MSTKVVINSLIAFTVIAVLFLGQRYIRDQQNRQSQKYIDDQSTSNQNILKINQLQKAIDKINMQYKERELNNDKINMLYKERELNNDKIYNNDKLDEFSLKLEKAMDELKKMKLEQNRAAKSTEFSDSEKSIYKPIEQQLTIEQQKTDTITQNLDAYWQQDISDDIWTTTISSNIENAITSSSYGDEMRVKNVACKSKLCKVEIENTDNLNEKGDPILFLLEKNALGNSPEFFFRNDPGNEGSGINNLTLFISSEGETLPEDALNVDP